MVLVLRIFQARQFMYSLQYLFRLNIINNNLKEQQHSRAVVTQSSTIHSKKIGIATAFWDSLLHHIRQAYLLSTMANEAPPAIQYRDLMAECQQLMTKVADLESDRNEHILVEDTLKPLDGGRRAYRLVGDVLVERTVAEVLPSITQNKNNVRKAIFFIFSQTALCE